MAIDLLKQLGYKDVYLGVNPSAVLAPDSKYCTHHISILLGFLAPLDVCPKRIGELADLVDYVALGGRNYNSFVVSVAVFDVLGSHVCRGEHY